MQQKIDHSSGEATLIKALSSKISKNTSISKNIKFIIQGNHKTYKYILVTALLAKAINKSVNSIALQAGAPIENAYDARSLCHKIVVPFERDFLSNALGGSNEPFLNKPARFTHLSTDNAVRNGTDRETLNKLIYVLSTIKSSEEAFEYLSYTFSLLKKVIASNQLLHTIKSIITPDLIDIYAFITRFIEKSFEGESCAIIVGSIEKQFYSCIKGKYRVIAHKVNQSGASSMEIGDIDIYADEKYFYSIEIKDKTFTIYDVEHAFNKIIENNGKKGAFIYGPRATFDENAIKVTLYSYEQKKFITLFFAILEYSRIMLFQTPKIKLNNFLQLIMDTAIEINAKDETKKWIHQVKNEIIGA